MSNFYNTYNARYLEPSQVAEKFIYSDSFETLIKNRHSVILGARGCGKTTLMKMLTLPALYNWKHEKADSIRSNLPFYAIYISTDVYWDVKGQTYDEQLKSYGNFADKISKFSVNSNVFIALCDTFINILKFELESDDLEKELELSKHLIESWKLDNTIPQLDYIRESLYERIDFVNQLVQNVIFNIKNESDIPHYDFFNLSFDSSVNYLLKIFTRIYKVPQAKKWALCFDELEFAPNWLQDKLYKSLRSRDQSILYKISSSPILPKEIEKIFKDEYSPSSGNDFDNIKMWNSLNSKEFSKELIESLLFEKFSTKDSKRFFGKNYMYLEDNESYSKDSLYMKEIIELAKKDFSFQSFLQSNNINSDNPQPLNEGQKSSIFRKIKPYVYFRNYFIDYNLETNLKPNYRTRNKAIELYSGIDVLSRICEGNPRWLIGLTNSILARSNETSVHERIQYAEIINISNRYINSIENIAVKLNDRNLSIKVFIDKIGNYFQNQILGQKFKMEPSLTLRFDLVDSKDYETLLEKGVFQGAFILVDNPNDNFDFEVYDKKFKLSYLYYPKYKLPIRKSNPTSLKTILNEKEESINLFNQEL